MSNMSEGLCCFAAIALTTTIVAVADLVVRAFFYEQTQHSAQLLPLLIGCIALAAIGTMKRNRNKPQVLTAQASTAGIRRVRVTGPVK